MKKPLNPYHQQASEWLKYANNDFIVAKDNFKLGHFSYVCQLCQQAAEKYLKAFLVFNGKEPKRTHLLRELIKDCSAINKDFIKLMESAKELEQYYIPTRYPIGLFGIYDKSSAEKALASCQKIVNKVKKELGKF